MPAAEPVGGSPPVELDLPVMVPGARSVARRTLRPLLRVWLRLRAEGLEHIPDEGPVIIASTHQSHADSIALGVAVERPVYFLGDVRLTRWPVLGPWLPRFGMVPLRRGEADADALGYLTKLLAEGYAVAVYPEGSRSRDGKVHKLRSGTARLAAQSHAPVVPAAVAGIYEVWPIGQRPRLRGGRVTVRFGPPLDPPAQTPRARREFNDRLHAALVELSGCEPADSFSPIRGGAEE